ncbi:MAG: aromatic ring-hydroxylating dioxygenase subunit alpha [Pseudomonadales bacterium]|nr:aromatic ring-hydroxylating dioxygenase subunit alpha [Pseudomonadales bacterium]
MVENHWYPVFTSNQLGTRPTAVTRFDKHWVLWRRRDKTPVMQPAYCPHRGASLAQGKVRGDEIECPWHGFRFNSDGRCTAAPCEGEVPTGHRLDNESMTVTEAFGLIWAWAGEGEPTAPPAFELMQEDLRNSAEADYILPYHHSRMIETNLDIHHTPFVHGSVLPGLGKEITEATFDEREDGFTFRANLGKPGEKRTMPFEVEFLAPALVRIALTEKLQLVVASTPATSTSSWLWFRYYQRYTNLPLVRKWISWLSVKLELAIVQRQDWRIFKGMAPGTIEDVDYHFVNADKPIMAYRKWRNRASGSARPVEPRLIASTHG